MCGYPACQFLSGMFTPGFINIYQSIAKEIK